MRNDKPNHVCQLLVRDLESGTEKELYRAPTWAERFTMSRSPDGKWLALINYKGHEKKERTLKVIPASGGEPHLLCSFEQKTNWPVFTAWTPDGKYFLFSRKHSEEDDIKTDLWRVPIEGGEPQKLGLTMARFLFFSLHPDGQRIAFSSFGPSWKESELWVMENFLPELKDNRRERNHRKNPNAGKKLKWEFKELRSFNYTVKGHSKRLIYKTETDTIILFSFGPREGICR